MLFLFVICLDDMSSWPLYFKILISIEWDRYLNLAFELLSAVLYYALSM